MGLQLQRLAERNLKRIDCLGVGGGDDRESHAIEVEGEWRGRIEIGKSFERFLEQLNCESVNAGVDHLLKSHVRNAHQLKPSIHLRTWCTCAEFFALVN